MPTHTNEQALGIMLTTVGVAGLLVLGGPPLSGQDAGTPKPTHLRPGRSPGVNGPGLHVGAHLRREGDFQYGVRVVHHEAAGLEVRAELRQVTPEDPDGHLGVGVQAHAESTGEGRQSRGGCTRRSPERGPGVRAAYRNTTTLPGDRFSNSISWMYSRGPLVVTPACFTILLWWSWGRGGQAESLPAPTPSPGAGRARRYLDVFPDLHGDGGHPVDALLILLVRVCVPLDGSSFKHDLFDFTWEHVSRVSEFH